MSRKKPDVITLEDLYTQSVEMLDQVVRHAFLRYKHRASPEDIARFRQRLSLLLLEDNYRCLRTYAQRAQLRAWLQVVANREIVRFLEREARTTSLEDSPLATFHRPPSQEEELLNVERMQLLAKAIAKLTPCQQQLVALIRQNATADEIAHLLGIKVASVHREKNVVIKKLRRLVDGGVNFIF